MMMTRTLALVASALLALASSAAANKVVVLGSTSHVHPVADAATKPFTPAGLAELAIGAFGLPTGEAAAKSNAITAPLESPVVHDLFRPVSAYAQVFVASSDAAVLDAVKVPAPADFRAAFTLESGAVDAVPAAVAAQLSKEGHAQITCVGASAICNHAALPHQDVQTAAIAAVLKAHLFLKESDAADMKLAQELAQTQQLTDSLKANAATRGYFVVSFSAADALAKDKQAPAREAIAGAIQDLVKALEGAYPGQNGVQLVASTDVAAVKRVLVAEGSTAGSHAGSEAGAQTTPAPAATTVVNATSTNSTSTVSATDIAEYQIVLWTSVLLVAALVMIIMAMCNMDSNRDSLLYAKFTANTNRKFD